MAAASAEGDLGAAAAQATAAASEANSFARAADEGHVPAAAPAPAPGDPAGSDPDFEVRASLLLRSAAAVAQHRFNAFVNAIRDPDGRLRD